MSEVLATIEDPAAAVWAEHGEGLRRFVRRRVRDREAAADVVQEVMLRVAGKRDALPAEPRARAAWVYRVARNVVIDHYRARGAKADTTADVAEVADTVAGDRPAETGWDAGEAAGCLRRMVGMLPGEYADALLLSDVEGMTQAAVAERLGVSVSGAKSRVQRARGKVRGMLLDCCAFEFDARGGVTDCRRTERSGKYCTAAAER